MNDKIKVTNELSPKLYWKNRTKLIDEREATIAKKQFLAICILLYLPIYLSMSRLKGQIILRIATDVAMATPYTPIHLYNTMFNKIFINTINTDAFNVHLTFFIACRFRVNTS